MPLNKDKDLYNASSSAHLWFYRPSPTVINPIHAFFRSNGSARVGNHSSDKTSMAKNCTSSVSLTLVGTETVEIAAGGAKDKEKPTYEHLQSEWQTGLEDTTAQKKSKAEFWLHSGSWMIAGIINPMTYVAKKKKRKKKVLLFNEGKWEKSHIRFLSCTSSDFILVWMQSSNRSQRLTVTVGAVLCLCVCHDYAIVCSVTILCAVACSLSGAAALCFSAGTENLFKKSKGDKS